MDTYKLVVQCKGYGASDKDEDYFKMRVEDDLSRLIDIAHQHCLDVLSVYLMKTTDSAPADLERENL